MADATVLKTVGLIIRTGSSPVSGTSVLISKNAPIVMIDKGVFLCLYNSLYNS